MSMFEYPDIVKNSFASLFEILSKTRFHRCSSTLFAGLPSFLRVALEDLCCGLPSFLRVALDDLCCKLNTETVPGVQRE